jgi:hypothetical protein
MKIEAFGNPRERLYHGGHGGSNIRTEDTERRIKKTVTSVRIRDLRGSAFL